MALGQLYPYLSAEIAARPLLHGTAGIWDEAIGLVGAIVFLILLIHLLFFDRERKAK